MTKVSVSLLSNKKNLEEYIKEVNNLDVDYIHLDIMDNKFVPYTSFTYDEIKKIIGLSNKPFDVHLMVNNIDEYIYQYAMLNTEYITIHYEALTDLKVIDKIKSYGIKCGISVNPNTDIELIYDILSRIDLVLIMSVTPGKGGQEFINSSLEKIKKLKEFITKKNLNIIISVDGGINKNSSVECVKNGADILVIGSALSNENNKSIFLSDIKNSC